MVDVRGEPGRPNRGADDGEDRLQQQKKRARLPIPESFVTQSLNSDFSDVSIRYKCETYILLPFVLLCGLMKYSRCRGIPVAFYVMVVSKCIKSVLIVKLLKILND